jgi:ligand-binding sensor protein
MEKCEFSMPGHLDNQTITQFAGLDLEKLQQLQDSFASVVGLATVIIDMEGRLVTKPSHFSEVCQLVGQTQQGREACDRSNLERSQRAAETDEPVYHMCQCCGFLDGSVPLIVDGERVGYWLVGQCNALGVDREDIALHAQIIGADIAAMLAAYDRMQPVSVTRFEQILDFLHLLVTYSLSRRC